VRACAVSRCFATSPHTQKNALPDGMPQEF
jgi:hypothetical protein